MLFQTPIISSNDTWVLWTVIIVFAAISIYLEQNYKWAAKISGPVIGLMLAIAASSLRIIPSEAPVYDSVWSYCLPVAMAMLLFRANLKQIVKDTGKLFICFNISAVGTLLGACIAFFALKNAMPHLNEMAGVMTGSYIGGGSNLFAIASTANVDETLISSVLIADNFVMAIAFFILLWLPSSNFGKKYFNHPFQSKVEKQGASSNAKTLASAYWGKKDISLLDLALTIAIAFTIAAVSSKIAAFLGGLTTGLLSMILGNQYVVLTVLAVVMATMFPDFFGKLSGAQEIGTFLTYVFCVVIGCPADLISVIKDAPLLFVFCGIIAGINILFTLVVGKFAKLNIEELTIASNGTLGGSTTAAAMAVAKGYDDLIIPGLLTGLYGNMIGTPLGLIIFHMLTK